MNYAHLQCTQISENNDNLWKFQIIRTITNKQKIKKIKEKEKKKFLADEEFNDKIFSIGIRFIRNLFS